MTSSSFEADSLVGGGGDTERADKARFFAGLEAQQGGAPVDYARLNAQADLSMADSLAAFLGRAAAGAVSSGAPLGATLDDVPNHLGTLTSTLGRPSPPLSPPPGRSAAASPASNSSSSSSSSRSSARPASPGPSDAPGRAS